MQQHPDRKFAGALALALLLPLLAQAQDADTAAPSAAAAPASQPAAPDPAPQQTAAATAPSAAPEHAKPAAPSSELNQTKDELTRLPSAADFKPNGPITIGANRAELVQNNSAVYVGNVTLDSDTLKMDGDRLDLKRAADGPYTAKITGSPAHMSHAGAGPDNPPVSARANTMTYDSRNGIIDLVGDAQLTRGDDKTTAETIHYHVAERRYEASGSDSPLSPNGGRVIIVIPQLNETPAAAHSAPSAAPSGAAPAAAGTPPATPPSTPAAPPASDGGGGASPKPQQDGQQDGAKP